MVICYYVYVRNLIISGMIILTMYVHIYNIKTCGITTKKNDYKSMLKLRNEFVAALL